MLVQNELDDRVSPQLSSLHPLGWRIVTTALSKVEIKYDCDEKWKPEVASRPPPAEIVSHFLSRVPIASSTRLHHLMYLTLTLSVNSLIYSHSFSLTFTPQSIQITIQQSFTLKLIETQRSQNVE